jgi:hypothetical protein
VTLLAMESCAALILLLRIILHYTACCHIVCGTAAVQASACVNVLPNQYSASQQSANEYGCRLGVQRISKGTPEFFLHLSARFEGRKDYTVFLQPHMTAIALSTTAPSSAVLPSVSTPVSTGTHRC